MFHHTLHLDLSSLQGKDLVDRSSLFPRSLSLDPVPCAPWYVFPAQSNIEIYLLQVCPVHKRSVADFPKAGSNMSLNCTSKAVLDSILVE